ncbi:MAG: tetratricopeptide repeat protein [Phycisphaerae bacterium]|nr:tetratricopeptide repeat protein [Phycisphaerae bacterium]
MRKGFLFLAAVIAINLICLPGGSAAEQNQARQSAYGDLDSSKLSAALEGLGMAELLESLMKEPGQGGDTPAGKTMLANVWITKAMAMRDLKERNKLLDEAIELLQDVAKATEEKAGRKTASGEDLIESYLARYKVIETIGLTRIDIYASRLMYIQGGQRDRRNIIEFTGRIIRPLEDLKYDVDETHKKWNEDLTKLITIMPRLEDIRKRIRYRAGWVYLYRGIALSGIESRGERRRMLRNAIIRAEKFAAGGPESGVKYWSLLLTGMASRELHEHAQAARYLQAANVPQAGPRLRIQAMFEIVRNLVEQALHEVELKSKTAAEVGPMFEQAKNSVADFNRAAFDLLGQAGQLEVALKTALLTNHLYESWAACQSDTGKANEYRVAAQNALIEFAEKFNDPGVQRAFFQIIANKYSGREDFQELNSLILLSLAVDDMVRDRKSDLAERLLELVLSRDDEVSKMLRPLAIFRLGELMINRLETQKAGDFFISLVKEFPDHRLARTSAINAVLSYTAIISERVRKKQPIAKELRQKYVRILGALLDKWDQDKDLAARYFDLGWQYQKLAEVAELAKDKAEADELMKKAIASYQKVPPGTDRALDARHWSLWLQRELLESKPSPQAEALITEMKRFAAAAKKAAAAADAKGDGERATELLEWGAQNAFLALEIQYTALGQKDRARMQLRSLGKEWPGTQALQMAAEFDIRELVKDGKTNEAGEKVREFYDKYPREAAQLMQLVLEQTRSRIANLRGDPAHAGELKLLRENNVDFAKVLYDRIRQNSPSAEELYVFKQIYAEAMVERAHSPNAPDGLIGEGIRLFDELVGFDEQRRRKMAEEIDRDYEKALKEIDLAGSDYDRMKKLAKEYFEKLKQLGLDRRDITAAVRLEDAENYLAKAADDEAERQKRLAIFTERLRDAYVALQELEKRFLPIDSNNLIGLARAYRLKKQYGEALEYYNTVIRGIDPNNNPKLYWSLMLEVYRCVLEASRENKPALEALLDDMRGLQAKDKNMGGLFGEFNKIEAEAKRLLTQ